MTLLEQLPASPRVCEVLRRLGARSDTAGFFYAACAVELALSQPQRMVFVTKWLYPDVARQYAATPAAVERGIRLLIAMVWEAPGELMPEIFAEQAQRPSPRQFIAALAAYLSPSGAEERG